MTYRDETKPVQSVLHHPDAKMADTPFDGTTELPVRRRRRRQTVGLGYFLLFVTAAVLLAVNNSLLRAMTGDVEAQRRTAEEAQKPAEVETITLIDPFCTVCTNVTNLLSSLGTNSKVNVTNSRTVDAASDEAVSLVNQYQLTRSPAFVISGETQKLLTAVPGLALYGKMQGDVFVGANVPAPYVEVASGQTRGVFEATYITEKNCQDCYDPTVNRQALKGFGMTPASEKIIERTDPEGRELVEQYEITSTPTLILTGDLAAYDGFDQAWEDVGTVEEDGAHVFRSGQSQMGTYYDLTTQEVVTPPQQNTNTQTP